MENIFDLLVGQTFKAMCSYAFPLDDGIDQLSR
jgi:hypothetical protein